MKKIKGDKYVIIYDEFLDFCREENKIFVNSQKGASFVEYALLVALIAVIVIAGIKILGEKTADKFCESGGILQGQGRKLKFNPATGQCEDSAFEN